MEPQNGITHQGQNTGIIEVAPRPGDFLAGAETAISHQPINPSGDWNASFPPGEWQKDMTANFETDACVSFSACDALETYANYCIENNLWPASAIQFLRTNGYFNSDNKTINFSDRFVARMSNTTTDGNSLPNVGDAIRHYGLVPESAWRFPNVAVEDDPIDAWSIYYMPVPANVQAIGQEFLRHFKPMYEWVKYPGLTVDLEQQLTITPLQIATAVCWPWNTGGLIYGCGPGAAHGTILGKVGAAEDDILDHYVPFVKHLAAGYDITYAMRHVLIPLDGAPVKPTTFHYTFTKQLTLQGSQNDATELHALQTALQTLNGSNGQPYLKSGVYGPFGPQTRAALDLFERDHHIVDPQPGCNFGPTNRAAMNAALNQ